MATNLYRFRFCPNLNANLGEAFLKRLPDEVCPEDDHNWQYSKRYEEAVGAIKIVEKQKSDGYVFTNEYYADGVRARGISLFNDLLRLALRDIGYPAMEPFKLAE